VVVVRPAYLDESLNISRKEFNNWKYSLEITHASNMRLWKACRPKLGSLRLLFVGDPETSRQDFQVVTSRICICEDDVLELLQNHIDDIRYRAGL